MFNSTRPPRRIITLAILALAVLVLAAAEAVNLDGAQAAGGQGVVLNTRVDLACPGPPGEPGTPPPCILPVGLDPRFVSPNPSGQAHLRVRDNDTARVQIQLDGLADDLVLTAWIAYFQPPGPVPHPIFAPAGAGLPPVAWVSAPLAPTTAGFTEGLGQEPNQFTNHPNGRASLTAQLDYNLLKAGQGPMRNGLVSTNQVGASPESGAFQPDCCPDGIPAPRPQGVGASFLRVFDPATGLQVLGPDGRPQLLRSPVPVAFLVVLVHIDGTTHGINAGNLIIPAPGVPATTGDHFTLGVFDLRSLQME